MRHVMGLRVYYEDTDLAGIVYYANYLKFIERGRTEALRALGIDQGRLKAETGIVFAVRRVEIDYRAPARFDDWLEVETVTEAVGAAFVLMAQTVRCEGRVLVTARVKIAAMDADSGRPRRLPAEMRPLLGPETLAAG